MKQCATRYCGAFLRTLQKSADSNVAIGVLFLAAAGLVVAAIIVSAHDAKKNEATPLAKDFHGRYIEVVRCQDIGEIPCGGLAPFSFEIRNISESSVRLQKGPASCTCLVSEMTSHVVQPSKSATITGTIEGGHRNGPQEIRFSLRAEPMQPPVDPTKTPNKEDVIFTVSGRVRTDRGVLPTVIRVKTMRETSGIIRRPFGVLWEAAQDATLNIESADLPAGVSIELPPNLKRKGGLMEFPGVIVVEPAKLPADGNPFTGSTTLSIKSPASKSSYLFTLHVVVEILNDVVAFPKIVSWSKAGGNDPVTVHLEAADGINVTIDNVSFDKTLLDCRVNAPAEGERHIVVKCLTLDVAKVLRTEIKVDLTYGAEQKKMTITVPVLIL